MRRLTLILLVGIVCLSACRSRQPEAKVEDPEVALEVDVGSVRLEPGLSTKIRITLTRTNFAEAMKLELPNLPAGMSAAPVAVGEQATTAEIELSVAANAIPAQTKTVHVVASAGEFKWKSKPFSVSVAPPSINYTFEPTHLKIPKGEARPLKVTLVRGREAYQGPIEIALANLPKNVTATASGKGPDGADWATFNIQAGAAASEGEAQPLVRVVHEKQLVGVALFPLTVQGEPFVLKVEPARVQTTYGQSAKVKITAERRDYQGPIEVKLNGLPGNVRPSPLTLMAKQSSGEIVLTVAGDVLSSEKTVQIRGSTNDSRHADAKFDLKIEGRPFVLQVQPARLEVVQGSSAKLKVIAHRAKDFSGPIDLEIRGLPKNCKAAPPAILRGKEVEIDITAEDAAALSDTANIQIVGSTQVAGAKREMSAAFSLGVVPTFSLQLAPGKVELREGQKATIQVNAVRRTYKGSISLELRNLPAGVVAAEAEIPRDKTSALVELTAGPGSSGKIKSDVHALGTSLNKKQGASGNITVLVLSKLFELKVEKAVKVTFGSKSAVKISAVRHDYQGAIAVELKDLPAHVKATKVVIPAGQNEIDLEVSAADDAKEVTGKAQVVGVATAAGNQVRTSDPFDFQVVPGLFDLKIEPALLQLHHNSSAKLTVIAQRKGHDGPITIELMNLPKSMKADKATIAKGENRIEIEVKAPATVTEGAKVDAFARGSASGKNVDSPRFVVNVVSFGQEPLLQLKVESSTLKLVPGESVKVKVSAVRKGYKGAIAVELRNLPPDVESSKGMIAAGESNVEITLTAKAKAEPITRADVCAVGLAVASENRSYASPQITVQVGRK